MIYEIDITERVIGAPSRPTIIQHNMEVDSILPHFDAEWEGHSISAIFTKEARGSLEQMRYSLSASDGQETVIPWELLEDTRPIQLTFVGYKDSSRLITLYSQATIEVEPSGQLTGATPQSPTVDQIEALVAEAQQIVESAGKSLTQIEGVIYDAQEAVGSATDAATKAEASAEAANTAADAANAAADRVDESVSKTDAAAQKANEAATNADAATGEATTAAQAANDAASKANAAAESATTTDEAVKAAEALRVEAEAARAAAEDDRASAEEARATAETERADKEAERQAAEALRVAAETARAEAEAQRAEDHKQHNSDQEANNLAQAKNNADQAQNNQAAMGLQFQILQEGEYEPETLTPTIEGAPGKFYLVPYSKGEGSDLYAEWIWLDQDKRFERVGNTSMSAEPVSTDQIDQVISGSQLTSENLLNGTGLAYYDKARKAANDALYATSEGVTSSLAEKADRSDLATAQKDLEGSITQLETSVDEKLALKADKTEIPNLAPYATKEQIENDVTPHLVPEWPMDENLVLTGNKEWKEVKGGGAGPIWLEVDELGDLYAYYDDASSPPNLEYEEETGDLYAIFETEGA